MVLLFVNGKPDYTHMGAAYMYRQSACAHQHAARATAQRLLRRSLAEVVRYLSSLRGGEKAVRLPALLDPRHRAAVIAVTAGQVAPTCDFAPTLRRAVIICPCFLCRACSVR